MCVHSVRPESTLSIGVSTASFFVSDFTVSLRLTGSSANVAVRFSVDDFVGNRFFKELLSCVSVRFSVLLGLEAPGAIVVCDGSSCIYGSSSPAGFTDGSSSSFSCTSGTGGGRTSGSVAGGMSGVVDFGFLLSSGQLCSAIRRTLRVHYPPVLTKCSSAKSLSPRHAADFLGQLRCEISRSLSHFREVSKHSQIHQTPTTFHDMVHPSRGCTRTVHRWA